MNQSLKKASQLLIAFLILGGFLTACSVDANSDLQAELAMANNIDPNNGATNNPDFDLVQQPQSTPTKISPLPLINGTLVDIGIEVYRETTSVFSNPVWSHNGAFVVFTKPGLNGGTHILVDTKTWSQETEICSIVQTESSIQGGLLTWNSPATPIWSPDDTKIALVGRYSNKTGDGYSHAASYIIVICEIETGELDILFDLDYQVPWIYDWSGKNLLIRAFDPESNLAQPALLNLESGQTNKLNLPLLNERDTPFNIQFVDSDHIIYMGRDKSILSVNLLSLEYEVLVKKGNVHVQDHKWVHNASLSPNGEWIIWVEHERTEEKLVSRIRGFHIKSGQFVTIFSDETGCCQDWSLPSWSPDSSSMVFWADGSLKRFDILP